MVSARLGSAGADGAAPTGLRRATART